MLSLNVLLVLIPVCLTAGASNNEINVEMGLSYDYLTPAESYDDWISAEIKYSNRFNPTSTLALSTGLSDRDEIFGWITAGIYHDWLPRFYTYSALTASTTSKWMGKWRADNDVNLKVGPYKQYILTFGQTAIYYTSDRKDYVLSTGGVIYKEHIILDGRYFFNWSEPGDVKSNSMRLSLGFGTMGKSWTTIIAGTGNQAYLALGDQSVVNQKINSIFVSEQLWLKKDFGIKIGAGYHKVENGYERYNVNIGYFKQIP